MSTLISMLVGSKLSTKKLVENSILSIISNIGTSDFLLVVGISSYIGPDIVKCIEKIKSTNANIRVITNHCSSFAKFHNHVFLKYGSGTKWFIVSHDDIQVETKGLVSAVEQSLQSSLDRVGWISFTNTNYLNGHWAPSTRPGYHDDVVYTNGWRGRKVYQFHLLKGTYWKRGSGREYFSTLPYDLPHSVVKCHAPFSHFFMIETEKLRKIGLCEDWSEVSLLIDEDWGLTALKKGLFNIWIPHINYLHCKDQDATRALPIIQKKAKHVDSLFIKKWGFYHDTRGVVKPFDIQKVKEEINKIKRMYGNTNIVWSMDKRTFDWEYLE